MNENFLTQISYKKHTSNDYPYNLLIFQNNFKICLKKPITFFVGKNGTGKSTLLESIAKKIGFNVLGGNKNHIYGKKYQNEQNKLPDSIVLTWKKKTNNGFFFRAESFFNFTEYIDELAYDEGQGVYSSFGGKSLQKQSHGESFLSLFTNKFKNGLFILDEPEVALSPENQLALIGLLIEITKTKKCQFLIATHSPLLVSIPNSITYEIENGKFIEKNFYETEQYEFYKSYLENPERYLKHLK